MEVLDVMVDGMVTVYLYSRCKYVVESVVLGEGFMHVCFCFFFFFNATATTEIYTLSLHDALRSKNTTIKIPAHNIPAFKPAKTFTEGVKNKVSVNE